MTEAAVSEVPSEELQFRLDGDSHWEAGKSITARRMARSLPRLVGRSLQLVWQVDRRSVIGLLGCQVISGASQGMGLLATTGTITALISSGDVTHRLWSAWPSVAVMIAAAGVRALLTIVVTWLSSRLAPVMAEEAHLLMLEASVTTELAAYDSPGFGDRRQAAERGADFVRDLLQGCQDLISAMASLAAGAAVLASVHPVLLPLLVLAALPQGTAQVQSAKAAYLAVVRTWGQRRMLSALRWHMTEAHTADQVRAGTMASFLLSTYRRIAERVNASERQAAGRGALMALLGAACGGLASGLVWAALVMLLATGRISVASAGTAVLALRTVTSSVQSLVAGGARTFRIGMYLEDWSTFVDEAGGYRLCRGTLTPKDPEEIRAENLVYRYEGSQRNALDGVTLTVRRGEVLALVGENGSGKTTLSKLLTGLYVPTSGSVMWDGVDSQEMDPLAAWQRVAVVPQEYARWPLSARENITLGQPTPGGDAAVWAACDASGADDVVKELRSGLDTLLAREWLSGEELSGGQWQRIAIARAFHRPAGLLVLDEPTAALDPRAEHRIFTGLRDLAATRAVVLVTHRLTNVAIADRIIVLDHGRIAQQGTFDELVENPGLFSELWRLQNDRSIPAERTTDELTKHTV
ncbi:ABC transporter ATP-binding protein [Streptantibioticus ferralitis]|uniref:ABC transporter ATP-binding protein n=1 Tax=Streptantibioticus ferralitis TaxID=236510 RepID=A0ABT5YS19_9ACTN|nr:ABC transporter ATP-binding protein [Streptantibioticus ferralitis]MDF2254389.1 ABC transporter ATP-binding protein [Streptantibioticus ferralitis]